jgi:hypothetical protein
MKKLIILIILIAIAIGGFKYYQSSDEILDEAFPITAPSKTMEQKELSKMEKMEMEKEKAIIKELKEDIKALPQADQDFIMEAAEKKDTMSQTEKMEVEKEIIKKMEKLPEPKAMDEPMELQVTTTPIPIKVGSFNEIDFIHKGSGEALIFADINGAPLLRLENFEVTRGPDLYVYLSKNTNIKDTGLGEFESLGVLKSSKGNQNYNLPSDYENYNSVVIWCQAFGVLFSHAELK